VVRLSAHHRCGGVLRLAIGLIMKNKPSIWGLLVGLVYGYVLCAALVPLIWAFRAWFLPIFGVGEIGGGEPLASEGVAAASGSPGMLLEQPQSAQICGIVIVIASRVHLWAARATTRATDRNEVSDGAC